MTEPIEHPFQRGGRPGHPPGPHPATRVAQATLLLLVCTTPWLFGGVHASTQVWLFLAALVPLLCWLIEQSSRTARTHAQPMVFVPLLAAIGFAALQLVPFPAEWTSFLSPAGWRLRTELAAPASPGEIRQLAQLGLTNAASSSTISLYPASTRHDLALLTLAVATFALGAQFFRTTRSQLCLYGIIAVNGAALSFFGLVQMLSWNGKLFWQVPLSGGGGPFASFVNRNNGAGFLNLCLAGAIALAIWKGQQLVLSDQHYVDKIGGAKSWIGRVLDRVLAACAGLNAATLLTLAMPILILGGIFCSLSRGAAVAALGAMLIGAIVLMLTRRASWHLAWLPLAVVATLGLVLWVGMGSKLTDRLNTLSEEKTLASARWPHWQDGLKAVPDFLRTGAGLGTYRFVYGLHQQRLDEDWYYHAENQYLEALVEGGIPGIMLLLATLLMVFSATIKLLRADPRPTAVPLAMAGLFAVCTQAIHAFGDFGLYLPANLLLLALISGAVCGRAAMLGAGQRWQVAFALPRVRSMGIVLAAVFFAGCLLGLFETRQLAAIESAKPAAARSDAPPMANPAADQAARLVQEIAALESAVVGRPDAAEAHELLANLYCELYRLQAFATLRAELPDESRALQLWQATSLTMLHARAHQLAISQQVSPLNQLRRQSIVQDCLTPALNHAILARQHCPLLVRPHLRLAELSLLIDESLEDQRHLARACQLRPADPDLLFRVGLLHHQAGRMSAAVAAWQASLSLDSRHRTAIEKLGGPALAVLFIDDKRS